MAGGMSRKGWHVTFVCVGGGLTLVLGLWHLGRGNCEAGVEAKSRSAPTTLTPVNE